MSQEKVQMTLGLTMMFINKTPKAKAPFMKEKKNVLKIKNFCSAKVTSNRMKRQDTEQEKNLCIVSRLQVQPCEKLEEKIFAKHILDLKKNSIQNTQRKLKTQQ